MTYSIPLPFYVDASRCCSIEFYLNTPVYALCVYACACFYSSVYVHTSTRKGNERRVGVGKRGCARVLSEIERERERKRESFINAIASKRENPPKAYMVTKKLMREYNNRTHQLLNVMNMRTRYSSSRRLIKRGEPS